MSLATSVGATTITFNGTAPEGAEVSNANTTHSEAGYSLVISSPAGGSFFIDNSHPSFPALATFDDDVLEFNVTNVSFVMTKDGGGLFDLASVITGSLGRDAADDGNFIFTGTFGGGGTISQTVLGLGFGVLPATTIFSGFTNLASLEVTSTDGQFPVMDNLVVTAAAPEPSNALLLGLGLAGVAALKRRSRLI